MACEEQKKAWDDAVIARQTAQANLAVAQQTYNVALATEMIAKQTYEICISMPRAMESKNDGLDWSEWRDLLIKCGTKYATEMEKIVARQPK